MKSLDVENEVINAFFIGLGFVGHCLCVTLVLTHSVNRRTIISTRSFLKLLVAFMLCGTGDYLVGNTDLELSNKLMNRITEVSKMRKLEMVGQEQARPSGWLPWCYAVNEARRTPLFRALAWCCGICAWGFTGLNH